MTTEGKLIYGGQLIRRWNHADTPPLENGALYEEAGRIVAIDRYDVLQRRYPAARRIGSAQHIVVPGFVNAHAHGRGLTTYQMGQPDEPLEPRLLEFFYRSPWGAAQAGGNTDTRNAGQDPYLDTLYSAAKQIASGITTTVHSHGYLAGSAEAYENATRPVAEGYRDSGIRCAFTLGIRDRNTFTFEDDATFRAGLPPALRDAPEWQSPSCDMNFEQYTALLRRFVASYPMIAFQFGPWNPTFCSDDLLRALADSSKRDGWRIQTHLNETKHQAAYGRRLYGKSWVKRLDEIGMLSPRFSGAHGIWLDDGDIEILRRSGAQIVYNPSSNLRLQSGLAPVREFLRAGIKVALGLDSLSLNDDDDMLQDMRLGQLIQSSWGPDGELIPPDAMLEMATATGAAVAGIEGIGSLSEGGLADVVLLSRPEIEGVRSGNRIAEMIVKRGRAAHVRSVIIGGKVMIEDGVWAGRTPAALLGELVAAVGPGERGSAPSTLAMKQVVRDHLRRAD